MQTFGNCKLWIIFQLCMLTLIHDNVKSNPKPKKQSTNFFSCCHWNINSILAHRKLSLLTAYNVIYKRDVICI